MISVYFTHSAGECITTLLKYNMDGEDKFPLHSAVRENKELTVRSILRTSPAVVFQRDDDSRTALFWAVSTGHPALVQLLLTTAKENSSSKHEFDIDDCDEAGWTVAHVASSVGHEEIMEMILAYEPDLTVQTNAGQTALHYAVSKGRLEIARRLAEACPAAVRIRDKRGLLPLHRAAAIGSVPLIKLLIEPPARGPINTTDKDRWSPLFHASAEGHGDAALALLRAGADPDLRDSEGHSFLDVAPDDKVRTWIKDNAKRDGIDL
ncbi:ankyrin repeat-containing domain protein, partial [Lipomyces oligophaga]|uniref:ankyrin repeat-containing domain protein n=1 Tax=Lipomyces oligophaga TaxID=45792 RepID=UPI0034CFF9C4